MSLEIIRTWFLLAIGLFFSTLVHEDVAILAGGCLVVENQLPATLAAGSLFGGVVLGDCAIYGLGRWARRSSRIRNWLPRLGLSSLTDGQSTAVLGKRLYWLVAACRLTPTILFPTFAAMGFSRVPFLRFALAVLISASLYVPTLFLAVVIFGDALVDRLKLWAWPVLAVTAIGIWLVRRHGSRIAPDQTADNVVTVHRGMPPLPLSDVRVPLSERIPPPLYYIPLGLQWFWLSAKYRSLTLPTLANPSIEAGGLMGESKIACMELIQGESRQWIARSVALDVSDSPANSLAHLQTVMAQADIQFPVIAKPDIGWRGLGVRRLNAPDDALSYLDAFPQGAKLILQDFVDYDGEAGVFYTRMPGEDSGQIFSLTFRYFPFVIGDGNSTLGQLIRSNPRTRWKAHLHETAHQDRLHHVPEAGEMVRLSMVGSSRVGGLYIDGRSWITPAMTARFDAIAKSMPEFWFGRFDVRFADITRFQNGEDFLIIEANGAGSEAIHMWDPNYPLLDGYKTLFAQQSLMFAIAAANRQRGFKALGVWDLIRCQQRQVKLMKQYPSSN